MRALPNQMPESRHSHRFGPMASASAEGQLSDLLDPDQLVQGVPLADLSARALNGLPEIVHHDGSPSYKREAQNGIWPRLLRC